MCVTLYTKAALNNLHLLIILANILDCGVFMGGILKKGLYSANVAYWDNMRSMATDFNNSIRDVKSIDSILNSDRLI